MGIFDQFFSPRKVPATPADRDISQAKKDDRLPPHPAACVYWKRVSSADWLKPDEINHAASRIAKNPQYYDWCHRLVDILLKKHATIVTQPVVRDIGPNGEWTFGFGAAVGRWMLVLPRGSPDQRHYCNGLAVCLTLPGFDTDEQIEDFVAKADLEDLTCANDGGSPFCSISDMGLIERGCHRKQSGLWISAIPVLLAANDRTFPRGKPQQVIYDYDKPLSIPNLRAFNPTSLPPTPNRLWNDGHISWLGNSSFLAFLDAWAAATPLSATDVAYGEFSSPEDQESFMASGFAEVCKACGATYFDAGDSLCARCGCRADDRDALVQYASSKSHADWVLGELKDQVVRDLQQVEEARRRADEAHRRQEEERLQQQRKLEAQRLEAEERRQERLRLDRERQDALAKMVSATESIAAHRRQLDEARMNGGESSDYMQEACLRKLREAIGQYETASQRYEQLQQHCKAIEPE